MPYYLRHYSSFASKIFLYDGGSSDRSVEIARSCPIAEVCIYSFSVDKCSEHDLVWAKSEAWKIHSRAADWIIACDIDEIIYHPHMLDYLGACKQAGITVISPTAFNIFSHDFVPTDNQIWADYGKGLRAPLSDDGTSIYDKMCVFDPGQIIEIGYEVGCHVAHPTGNVVSVRSDELKMFHYKHVGFDRLITKLRDRIARATDEDYEKKWVLAWDIDPVSFRSWIDGEVARSQPLV
jgi:hypothetical protein